MTPLLEIFRQFSFVAAVLGGFAVALALGLLPLAPGRRIAGWAVGAALLASALLIVCTIAGVTAVMVALDRPAALEIGGDVPATLRAAFRWCGVSFTFGLIALLASLGLSGWIRSRQMGLVSSSVAGATILLILYFLGSVVSLL